MRFEILTIFPNIFDSFRDESLIKRAIKKKIIKVEAWNLRDFSPDKKHKKVDDKPYGGGPGMVLMVEPIYRAAIAAKGKGQGTKRTRIILFSTRGKKLNAKIAKRLAACDRLILICGRYEGVDERVAKYIADEEISLGDYVLNGGETAAMVLMEAVSRFLPGFLGKTESLEEIKGSFATYTRPAEFIPQKGAKPWRVPKVLLSGHHKKIKKFRIDI